MQSSHQLLAVRNLMLQALLQSRAPRFLCIEHLQDLRSLGVQLVRQRLCTRLRLLSGNLRLFGRVDFDIRRDLIESRVAHTCNHFALQPARQLV